MQGAFGLGQGRVPLGPSASWLRAVQNDPPRPRRAWSCLAASARSRVPLFQAALGGFLGLRTRWCKLRLWSSQRTSGSPGSRRTAAVPLLVNRLPFAQIETLRFGVHKVWAPCLMTLSSPWSWKTATQWCINRKPPTTHTHTHTRTHAHAHAHTWARTNHDLLDLFARAKRRQLWVIKSGDLGLRSGGGLCLAAGAAGEATMSAPRTAAKRSEPSKSSESQKLQPSVSCTTSSLHIR